MGFAIKREDGTYRSWSRNAKEDALRPGEVYEELESMPTITPDALTNAERDAIAAALADEKPLRATVMYLREELNIIRAAVTLLRNEVNAVRAAGVTLRDEINAVRAAAVLLRDEVSTVRAALPEPLPALTDPNLAPLTQPDLPPLAQPNLGALTGQQVRQGIIDKLKALL